MADWETGYVMAELNSKRFFRKNAPEVNVTAVGLTKQPVITMGGLTIVPDITLKEISVLSQSILLLPGGNTWSEEKHGPVVDKAKEILTSGGTVAAICGATLALASAGLLDERPHTSNGPGFLEMFCPSYRGTNHYVDEPAVSDGKLITAAGTAPLEWAREILDVLGVFTCEKLQAWYSYSRTGEAEYFHKLMNDC
ncbi:MAG: type 1 glutamine amidotransferase family protein [Bullifex sp.]|nr:type 1 glutamine amidotransferase family protein [Bullifex sp.]